MKHSSAFLRTIRAGLRYRSGSQWPSTVPTTVAWGTKDRLLFYRQSKVARRRIPQAHHVPLPDCGHIPAIDDPSLIIDVIDETITRARQSKGRLRPQPGQAATSWSPSTVIAISASGRRRGATLDRTGLGGVGAAVEAAEDLAVLDARSPCCPGGCRPTVNPLNSPSVGWVITIPSSPRIDAAADRHLVGRRQAQHRPWVPVATRRQPSSPAGTAGERHGDADRAADRWNTIRLLTTVAHSGLLVLRPARSGRR